MTEEKSILDNPEIADFLSGGQPKAAAPKKAELPIKQEKKDDKAVKPKPKTKLEIYHELLEEEGITQVAAAKIVDSLLTKMQYEEEVKIGNYLTVRFRTRTAGQIDRVQKRIRERDPRTNAEAIDAINKFNLASSLVFYDGHELDTVSDDGFNQVLNLVDHLASPFYAFLVDKLAAFDRKINIVMREGGLENF